MFARFGPAHVRLSELFGKDSHRRAQTLSYNSVRVRLIESGRDWHDRGFTSWRDCEGVACDRLATQLAVKRKGDADDDHH